MDNSRIIQKSNRKERYEYRTSRQCCRYSCQKLPYIESLYEQAKEEVDNLKNRKLYLLKDVDFLSAKVSRLQETILS
jgi:hypothetical protein